MNILTFVNHACFHVRTNTALLLVDPWLEGTAFNDGWRLLDQSTSNAALVEQLGEAGVPVYIWYSHEHPDHFSISFIKKFREKFRGRACFLFQRTYDRRVVGFLKRHEFEVIECKGGVPVALGRDLAITVFPFSGGDSFCLINAGGRTILNLNDCALSTAQRCLSVKKQLDPIAPRIDLMLTQFGYANWVGNPDQQALRKRAAEEKIERVAMQVDVLKPAITVPFASFVYFSHRENAYLNDGQNSAGAVAGSPRLAGAADSVRFLQPGGTVDLDRDTPATLFGQHALALEHWSRLAKAELPLQPSAPAATLVEVQMAFLRYEAAVSDSLHGLPQFLELTRRIVPLVVRIDDLQQTVQVSYRSGLTVLGRDAPFHVSMTSATAIFLFKNEYGFDTTHVNGRFRAAPAGDALIFSRFFLPQRMRKNGYDRRHPFIMGRYLAGNVASRAAGHMHAALRKLSSPA